MTKKVLVITDAQREFITGALGNKECEAAVKNIVAAAESGEYYKVIFTKDTHTADYLNTQEGKRLPVLHGQEGTEGYEIHPEIVKAVREHYAPEQDIADDLGGSNVVRRGHGRRISHGSGFHRILYRDLRAEQCGHGEDLCAGSKSVRH